MPENAEFVALYDELRKIAGAHMARAVRQPSLQPTQLVHEAWLRLSGRAWRSKTHFLALASRAMRMVLIDAIRERAAQKRPSSQERVELAPGVEFSAPELTCSVETVIDLDRVLHELAAKDPRKAEVVEMRFFGGLEFPEIAEALGVSVATAKRDWEFARVWLFSRLSANAVRVSDSS